ncbi:MAG: isocitrate/isopropylmalate family dehydrogenase [Nanoarchaeota archaeon]|nr:isocitrate/isopropylmalate family dehydrogenase [Nanoarchaeota archaeon]
MKFKIAVFPGDGVGPELINEGIKVIEKAAELDKFEVEWVKYLHGAEHYLETKEILNEKILKEIKSNCNAIYCGTFDNSIKEANEISNSIRNYFDQFVSLRPIKLLPTVETDIAGRTRNEIDFVIIRENTEDFYVKASGTAKNGKSRNRIDIDNGAFKAKFGLSIEAKGSEIAYHIGILSKRGCERFIRYAFEYARAKNKKKISAIDKVNVIDAYKLWRENFDTVAKGYQDIEYEFHIIDAAVMNFIRQPEKYEIVVAPNMFGDILSSLGTAIQGGLLFAARGNINPEGISMFEPVHGSAPKLKDKGIINPIATIWAGALMLDSIGQPSSSDLVIKAMESVLKDGRTRTEDLGGNNTTSEMGDAIVDKLIEIHD